MKIRSHFITRAAVFSGAALLAACGGGGGSGSSSEGIEVSIKAGGVGTPYHDHEGSGPTSTVFRRSDGMKIELELGLLNLVPVELQSCGSTAAMVDALKRLNPIGSAYAHSGHAGEPPEGAVSILATDAAEFDLGSLPVAPGTYCGLVVELQPGTGEDAKHGGELDTSMTDAMINVAPCFYPDTVGQSDAEAEETSSHHCTQAKVGGEARRVTLPFATPVTLDANNMDLNLRIGVRYETWFNELDMELLEGHDADNLAEQAKLLDNVANSLYAISGDDEAVTVAFKTFVNGEQAQCGKVYQGVGNGEQQDYELRDFRFYVSDLHLHGPSGTAPLALAPAADGTTYQDDDHSVALLGLVTGCDGTPDTQREARLLHGTAAAGTYDEICFTLGLPFALNHLDPATAPSPMNVTAMNWAWLYGNKFLRADGVGDADGERVNYFLHLGSTGCTNSGDSNGAPPDTACGQPNLAEVCLSYPAVASGHSVHVDVGAVLADSDITFNTEMTAPGCMSGTTDPECLSIMPKLGLDYEYNGSIVPAEPQVLFSVGE